MQYVKAYKIQVGDRIDDPIFGNALVAQVEHMVDLVGGVRVTYLLGSGERAHRTLENHWNMRLAQ